MRSPDKNLENCRRIFEWVAEGKLKPHVDESLPFSRAQEALERLEQRKVKGKIVLVPDAS